VGRFRLSASLVGPARLMFLVLVTAFFAVACGESDPETDPVDSRARIDAFSVSPVELDAPGDVTLSWQTSHAISVVLTANGTPVSLGDAPIASGSIDVRVEVDTTFELIAAGADGSKASESRDVMVTPALVPPTIAAFSGPESVSADEFGVANATLAWTGIVGANEVILEAEPGSSLTVDASQIPDGGVSVEITQTTTFGLVARNDDGETRREHTVRVVPLPTIDVFEANQTWVGIGDSVTFTWETTGASTVELWVDGVQETELDPGLEGGSHDIVFSMDSTVELRAFNSAGGMVFSTLDIVVARPELNEFTASATSLWLSETVRFEWTSDGAKSFAITASGIEGNICAVTDLEEVRSGSCEWTPPVGNFIIDASASNGSGVAGANWTLSVGSGPQITAFTVEPDVISDGDSVTVTWATLPDPDGVEPTLSLRDDRGNPYSLEGASGKSATFPISGLTGELELILTAATDHELSFPVESSAMVTVLGLPIATLTATPAHFDETQASEVVLSWTSQHTGSLILYRVEGEDLVEVLAIPEEQRASGEYRFVPSDDAIFRLVAVNPLGESFSVDANVTIAPPEVITLTADKTEALIGEPVLLTWTTKMAESRTLNIFGTEYVRGESQEPYKDISATGTHLPLTTECSTSLLTTGCVKLIFPDSFSFPFDGKIEPAVRINNNGFLSFQVDHLTSSSTLNSNFPTSSTYDYVHIAPFWDALTWNADRYPTGNIYYALESNGDRGRSLTIQWKDVTQTSNRKARLNFQVVLWEDGRFEYRYGDMEPGVDITEAVRGYANGRSATVGYQTASKRSHDVIQYNTSVNNIWGSLSYRTFTYSQTPPLVRDGSYLWFPFASGPSVSAVMEAARGTQSHTKGVSVTIIDRPAIVLTDRPDGVTVGTTFRLGWNTVNATSLVLLDEGGTALCTAADQGEVNAGFCEITETVEKIYNYTIRVVGQRGVTVEKPIEIVVYEPFSIKSFSLDKTILEEGEPLTVSWNTENAHHISLLANDVELLPSGAPSGPQSLVLPSITADTTFVLRVTNALGMFVEETQKVTTWKVRLTMTPSTTKVRPGEPVTITISADALDGGPQPEIFGSFPMIDVPNPPAYTDISGLPWATQLETRPSNPDFPFPQTEYGDLILPQGFNFPYFGETFASARVYAHGVVAFVQDTDGNVNNQILPHTSTAYRSYHLAPFWDNLQARGPGAGIWTGQPDANTFIIQWTKFSGTTGSTDDSPYNLNFQVALFKDGTFEYRYGAMDPPTAPGSGCQPAGCANEANGSSATIGYHARRGRFGTTHHFGGTGNAATNPTYPGGLANRLIRFQPVANGGQMTFHPTRNTTYTICAMSGVDLVCKDLLVDASFGISSFTVDESTINFNDSTVLRWTSDGATSLRILDGDGQVVKSTTDLAEIDAGSMPVTPLVNTRYTLELTGPHHRATATVFVEVIRLRMQASGPRTSHPGAPVTISWVMTKADPDLQPVIATPMVETTGPGNLFADMDISNMEGTIELEGRPSQTTATHLLTFDPDFTFNFLGTPRTFVRVGTVGALSFEAGTSSLAAGNTMLPSSGTAAQKLIHLAPFWDTLNTRDSGRIYARRFDQDTYVIQWHRMSLTAGSTAEEYNLNFMVVLRRNGDFEFRYGAMEPPANSTSGCTPVGCWHEANGSTATIGYSDPTNKAGFTLNYGATAADMQSIPGGLTNRSWKYTSTSAATGSVQVAPWSTSVYRICAVDAVTGDVECSNPVDVEIKWGITGFDASPDAARIGEAVTLMWDVKGMDRLRLLADDVVLFDHTGASIVSVGTFNHTPNKETVYLLEGTSAGRVVTAEKTVVVRTFSFDFTTPSGRYFPGDEVTISWNIVPHESGTMTVLAPLAEIDASPGQPGAYNDISGVGSQVTMSSTNGFATVTMPFNFPYFGGTHNQFIVYVDGYISFDLSGATGVGSNTTLPNSGTSQRRVHLAPFWDDLFMRGSDSVWTHSPTPDTFIVQWKNFNRSGGSSSTSNPPSYYDLNFQIVFYSNGLFEFRYGTMAPPPQPFSYSSCYPNTCELEANGSSATIGYQSTDGLLGKATHFGNSTSSNIVPFPGGLNNRSFKFAPDLTGSTKVQVGSTAEYSMCAVMTFPDAPSFEECKTVTVRPVADPGDLMFTELMINPTGGQTQQWIEIRNLSRSPIDLSGFKLRNTRGEHTITGALPVAPGGLVVLAASNGGSFTPDYVYGTDLNLHHEVDSLELLAGTATIATASWDGSWTVPFGTSLSLDSSYHLRGVTSNAYAAWCAMNEDDPSPGTLGVGCRSADYDVDAMGVGTYYDLSLTGQPVRDLEATSSFVGLDIPGFSFPFFDGVAENLWVGSNGWVSFSEIAPTSGSSTSPSSLPRSGTAQPPGPLVGGFWSTLRCNPAVHDCAFRYQYGDFDGKRALILDWSGYRYSTSVGSLTFQIQLWSDGDIKVVFDDVWSQDAPGSTGHNNYNGNTATIFLESADRTVYTIGNQRNVVDLPYRTFHFKKKR